MAFEPNPQQALLIFSMLLGDKPEQREPTLAKCGLEKKLREALIKKKLVQQAPRGRAAILVLTDEGREWALGHLFCQLPPKARRSKAILTRLNQALVPLLQDHRDEVERRLGITRDSETDPESSEDITVESIQGQIRDAYLGLTGGKTKQRVLFSDLRPKVPVVSDDFDHAVLSLQEQQKVVLAGLDNPVERTPEVEAAAIHIAGNPRHLLYFQG